jgi:hypothetical protein
MFARLGMWAVAWLAAPQESPPATGTRADRPATAQESAEVAEARRIWRAADSETGARADAAARLLKANAVAELVAEIDAPTSTAAQLAALEAFTRTGAPAAARSSLAWLAGPDGAVARAARGYLAKLANDRRPEFVALVAQALADPAADAAEWCGAATAAEGAPDLAYVAPLIARLEGALGGAGHASDCVAALERIAGRRYGADLAAWRRWWSDAQGRSREQLLDEALRASAADLAAKRTTIAALQAERLHGAPAEMCAAALDEESSEIRRVALERLSELLRRGAVLADDLVLRLRGRVLVHVGAPLGGDADRDEEAAWGALAAELSPRDPAVVALLLARFRGRDPAVPRTEYLPALRRCVRDQSDATVARTIESALAATADAAARGDCVRALAVVGDDASFGAVALLLADSGSGAALREAALTSAAELARRSRDPALVRRAIDLLAKALADANGDNLRVVAALGLGVVLEALCDSRPGSPAATPLSIENVNLAFDALRRALPSAGSDRNLAEPCCRALCRVASRREDAANVLKEVLSGDALAPKVREVYMRGLKELEHPAGLAAIAAALPRGGKSVEPDAVGREAYAALQAILRRAAAEGRAAAVEIAALELCAAKGQHEWVVDLATPVLAAGGPIEAGPELRKARLLFGESAAHLLDAEILGRGFKEMKAVLADAGALPDERLRATRVLLAIGDRNRPTFGREAAERAGRELETAGFDAAARRDLAQRAALLLFSLGEWNATIALLGREFDAATAPLEVLVTWARSSERVEGAEAAALALHERLLGAQGSGGRMAADAAERPSLLLGLARLYLALQRRDDARATLGRLPAVVALPPELTRERERIEDRLRADTTASGG